MTQANRNRQQGLQQRILLGVLLGCVLSSALGLVYSKQHVRKLVSSLQVLHNERDELYSEWTQLLLEQSAWTADGRVDTMARNQLEMTFPKRIFVRELE